MGRIRRYLNTTITMNKLSSDFTGKKTVQTSFKTAGFFNQKTKRTIDRETGEKISAEGTFFVDGEESKFDPNHNHWTIIHNGRTFRVNGIDPIRDPRRPDIVEHYELEVL